jgi:hypothetical protein
MDAWRSTLGSADMQPALVELDLMPFEAADFACSQPMAIGDQDHRCIAMAMSADLAGSVHELLDLALGEVAALDCEVFSVWCAAIGCLICHEKSLSAEYDCKDNRLFLHSMQLGICLLFHADATHPNIVAFDGACDQRRTACVLLQPMS